VQESREGKKERGRASSSTLVRDYWRVDRGAIFVRNPTEAPKHGSSREEKRTAFDSLPHEECEGDQSRYRERERRQWRGWGRKGPKSIGRWLGSFVPFVPFHSPTAAGTCIPPLSSSLHSRPFVHPFLPKVL